MVEKQARDEPTPVVQGGSHHIQVDAVMRSGASGVGLRMSGWVVWLSVFASSCAAAGPVFSAASAAVGLAQLHQGSETTEQQHPQTPSRPDTSVRLNEAMMMKSGFRLLEPADMSDLPPGMTHFVVTDAQLVRVRHYFPSLEPGEPVYIWSDRQPGNCSCQLIGDHAVLEASEEAWLTANSGGPRSSASSPPAH